MNALWREVREEGVEEREEGEGRTRRSIRASRSARPLCQIPFGLSWELFRNSLLPEWGRTGERQRERQRERDRERDAVKRWEGGSGRGNLKILRLELGEVLFLLKQSLVELLHILCLKSDRRTGQNKRVRRDRQRGGGEGDGGREGERERG
jgi:hypothetical protein